MRRAAAPRLASAIARMLGCAALVAGFEAGAQTESNRPSLDQLFGETSFPGLQSPRLTITPPPPPRPTIDQVLADAQFPAPRDLMLRIQMPTVATVSLDELFAGAQFPTLQSPRLTITSPPPPRPTIDQVLADAQFPAPKDLALRVQVPAITTVSLDALFADAQFPSLQSPRLTITPPRPTIDQVLADAQFPSSNELTLRVTIGTASSVTDPVSGVQQPLAGMPSSVASGLAGNMTSGASVPTPPLGRTIQAGVAATPTQSSTPVSTSTEATSSNALAAVAHANFPEPQQLTVVLVPQPSPYTVIASANFPEPSPLSVTLVPAPSPYTAVASANFPSPSPLSVVLVPDKPAAPPMTFIPPQTTATPNVVLNRRPSVQIVQVIHRRGANFFDRNDPTGEATVTAQTGTASSSPPSSPPSSPTTVCGTTVYTDGLGNPFASPPTNAGVAISYPVIGGFVALGIQPGSTWDSYTGVTTVNSSTFTSPSTTTVSLQIGCPNNTQTNRFALRFSASAPGVPTVVCVTRQALQAQNCDAQGN